MLEQIIDSNQKSAVIAFLAIAPERSFSSKELSKRLQIPEPTVITILQSFIKLKIVTLFVKKGKKYYLANSKNNFFNDIRSGLRKQQKYDDELLLEIVKLGDVKAAFLSGIFTGQPQLPVDLLIVGKVNDTKLDKFLNDVKVMMGQEINHSIMSVEEFDIRRHTFDRFIKDIFDYPHLAVMDVLKLSNK